jgi:hypothetical protein
MSSSRSSPTTTTQTTDARTSNAINSGIGGDISDAFVATGNYGATQISSATSSDDNSLSVDMTDNSDNSFSDLRDQSLSVRMDDSSTNTSNQIDNSIRMDESDNSLKVDMTDLSGSTNSGNTTTDNSYKSDYKSTVSNTTNVTDGGAFKLLESSFGKMIDVVGLSQKNTLSGANDLASRSIDAAMSVKRVEVSGGSIDPQLAKTGMMVAGAVGLAFAATKMWGKK